MFWKICFFIALAIVLLALVVMIVRMIRKKDVDIFKWLVASAFLSTFVMFLPLYSDLFFDSRFGILRTVLLSFHNTIRLFVVDADYMFIIENIKGMANEFAPFYTAYMAILFIVCPIFTFGFILSFFKNVSARLKLFFHYFSEIYVFSELNDSSITLAKDLKKNNPRRVIVFCDVFENNEEASYELMGEVKQVGAICFKRDILNVNFKLHSAKKGLYFFAIGEDNEENINQSLNLIATYGEIENTNLYLFSNSVESELLLSTVKNKKIKVRRINVIQSLINKDLYYNGVQLFSNARETDDPSKKEISAIVVGMGQYGVEMVKTLVWYCQMDGYSIRINAFDQDPQAKDKFVLDCPEIMSDDYNGVYVDGEAQYRVDIHSGMVVGTNSFAEKIKEINDATYVFVALGSDEENIKMAVMLRTQFERMGIKPIIQAVVYNSKLAKHLTDIKNYRGQSYGIDLIGDFESIYSESVIIDSELEADALKRHLKWGKEEDFWQYEYNYRSSTASAIHMRARIACGIPGAGKAEDELTEEEIAVIEPLEHKRWNAYMRSQGYLFSGSKDKSSRNDLGKMHHDLVDFESLSEEDKRKDRSVGSK